MVEPLASKGDASGDEHGLPGAGEKEDGPAFTLASLPFSVAPTAGFVVPSKTKPERRNAARTPREAKGGQGRPRENGDVLVGGLAALRLTQTRTRLSL
jgi:hypothetical protein